MAHENEPSVAPHDASSFEPPAVLTNDIASLFKDGSGKTLTTPELHALLRDLHDAPAPVAGEPWGVPESLESRMGQVVPAAGKKALVAICRTLERGQLPEGLAGEDRWLLRLFRWFSSEESLEIIDRHAHYTPKAGPPDERYVLLRILLSSAQCDAWKLLFKIENDPWFQPPSIEPALQGELEALGAQLGAHPDTAFELRTPSFGLDPRGTLTHVDGDHRVTMTLVTPSEIRLTDAMGRPWVKPEGKKKSDLAEKGVAALVKASLRDIERLNRSLATHLEQRMIRRKSWAYGDWARVFLAHPLWSAMARALVWRTSAGQSFRVDESGELCTEDQRPLPPLPADREVFLAHPVDLGDDTLYAWKQQLADYEILQPFPQLDRPFARPGTDLVNAVQGAQARLDLKFFSERGWWDRASASGTLVLAHTLASKNVTARVVFTLNAASTGLSSHQTKTGELTGVQLRELHGNVVLPMSTLDDMTYSEVWGHFLEIVRQGGSS